MSCSLLDRKINPSFLGEEIAEGIDILALPVAAVTDAPSWQLACVGEILGGGVADNLRVWILGALQGVGILCTGKGVRVLACGLASPFRQRALLCGLAVETTALPWPRTARDVLCGLASTLLCKPLEPETLRCGGGGKRLGLALIEQEP